MSEKTVSGIRVLSEAETELCAGGSLTDVVQNAVNQTSRLVDELIFGAGEVLTNINPPIQGTLDPNQIIPFE